MTTTATVPELIARLTDGEEREAAIEDLVDHGSEAVAPLLDALPYEDGAGERTASAARALAALADDSVVSRLQEMLLSRDWRERTGAAIAFEKLGGDRAVAPLMDLLFSESSVVLADGRRVDGIGRDEREYAEIALQNMGDDIVERVSPMLGHEEHDYRIRAIRLLDKSGSEKALEALERRLPEEEDPSLRQMIASVLGRHR